MTRFLSWLRQIMQQAFPIYFLQSISRKTLYVVCAVIISWFSFSRPQTAFCVIDCNGFRFTVEKHGCLQAHVYLKRELFSEFKCTGQQQFGINLTILLDCLSIFSSSDNFVSLQISFAGEGSPLLLDMIDGIVSSSGGIYTIDTCGPTDFCWAANPAVNRIIVQSSSIKELLTELEWWGNHVEVLMSPDPPHFRLASTGDHGSCSMCFPSSCEIFDEFACRETQTEIYKSQWVQCVFKALGLSEKACLRMNSIGMLNIQLMIRDNSPVTTFVEFLLCANYNDIAM
mmetsp:Transcript_17898/g.49570  ORF Transcript_17898/g.49570 Transcript_17898/m.49570 type:complete len:285 (-) Transcript_17898:111-965(-)